MARLKKKVKKTFKKLLILIILVIGSFLIYENWEILNKFVQKQKDNQSEPTFNIPAETYPKSSTISLVATGDGLLHNAVYIDAYDKATKTFDFSNQLVMVKDIISKYDLAYYNQETIFGGAQPTLFTQNNAYQIPGYSSFPYFNSPSEFGDAMVDVGFNMVSLASNHSVDCTRLAKDCIVNAYNYWKTKDVVFDGFNPTAENTNNYIIKEEKGIKYTMLNYTTSLNGLDSRLNGQEYLVDTYDKEKVKADIEAVRDKVDLLVVAMHWHTGSEYTFNVTEKNKEIAKYLSELGVDIILGTYSHCLQPFEFIDDTLVFYSLGNFISNQGDLISSYGYKGIVGVLASVDITKTTYEDGKSEIKIDNIGADLTYTYNKNHRDYLVIPFSKMDNKYNKNCLSIYNEYSEVLKKFDKNINIAPPADTCK